MACFATRPGSSVLGFAIIFALCAENVLSFHVPSPSMLPLGRSAAHSRRMRPKSLAMSFVPDKEAIKQNFAKVPDHINLRDPCVLTDPTTKEKVEIYSNGACLTSYVTGAGYDVLFRRPDAVFDGSKPISGGVPICWPQCGPGNIQQHGFARNLKWACVNVKSETAQGSTQGSWLSDRNYAVFELKNSNETKAMWDNQFQARYEVLLSGGSVKLELRVQNTGYSKFNFTCALHTYFAVDDIDKCSIIGLKGKT